MASPASGSRGRLLRRLLLTALCWPGFRCAPGPETPLPPLAENIPEQEFREAVVEYYEGGSLRGILSAEHMQQFRRKHLVLLFDAVQSVNFDSLGRVESVMTCDTLYYRRDKRDLKARGHVIVSAAGEPDPGGEGGSPAGELDSPETQRLEVERLKSSPAFRLRSEALDWVERIRKIRTELPVVFESQRDTVRGVGFQSDRDLGNWEIYRPEGVSHRRFERSPGEDGGESD